MRQKQPAQSLKDIMVYARKMMTYLGETLQLLANKLDDELYILLSFLVYKALSAIQKDVCSKSVYWDHVKAPNKDAQWDLALTN